MELIDFKSSCKDCCNSKTKIEACASGKPIIIFLDELAETPTVKYFSLLTGELTTTAPAHLTIGNCSDLLCCGSTEEVIQGEESPAVGDAAPTGSKLFFDTVTQKITRANVDGVWVEIADSSLSFSDILTEGNKILTITDSDGVETEVFESVTEVTAITDGFSYKNETGEDKDITFEINDTDPLNTKVEVKLNGTTVAEFPLYTVDNDIQINNAGSEWSLTDDQITIVETNGDTQVLNFPYRVTVVANPDGTIDIKQNGVTIGTVPAPAADIKYSKALFVDPINGSDTTGTGSDNNMFKTIAKALTVADGSGFRIVLAPGIYAENPTISLANLDIVTLAGSDRGNTSIQGTVTFSHTSSSSGIQGIAMTDLRHSGAGALYVTDCQVNGGLVKNSTGYIEITDTQLQSTTTTSLNAGTGLIKDSLIKNMTIQGASSGYTLKSNIIDADGTVTFTGGAFYNIQDNSGNIVTTAGVNMETGLIASGLSSALAKQYVTDFSNKLGMINPDTNNANVNVVSWNTTTRRLEVSALPIGGAVWYSGTNVPSETGNTASSLGVATLPANYYNTTTGNQYYVDANGVSKLIEKGYVTTSLTPQYGNGTTHVNAQANAQATVADVIKLSTGTLVNNEDVVTWTGHGLTLHAWYFLDPTTAGAYTIVPPVAPNYSQRLFYVVDANTVKIAVQEAQMVTGSVTYAPETRGYATGAGVTTHNALVDVDGATITLPAGTYQIGYNVHGTINNNSNGVMTMFTRLATGGNIDVPYSNRIVVSATPVSGFSAGFGGSASFETEPITITTATTYKIRMIKWTEAGTPNTGQNFSVNYGSYIYAKRII